MKRIIFTNLTACFLIFLLVAVSPAQTKRRPVAELPFELYKNLIILKITIGGKGPFNMMLDTGTNPSAVDLAAAKLLGLNVASVGEKGVGSGTGENLAYDTSFPVLRLGKLKAKNVEASATDLSLISKALGMPLHGILGHSLLNNRIIEINYPKRLVRFYSKSPFQTAKNQVNNPNQVRLPFRYANESILVDDVYVNGKKVTTLFDTGFNGVFNVMPAAITTLGLEEDYNNAKPKNAVGYRGVSENREGKIKSVRIGTINVDSPTVIFWGKNTGHDSTTYGFTIGNGFLKDFTVTIDYQNSVITLERGGN